MTGHVHSYSDRLEKNSSDGGIIIIRYYFCVCVYCNTSHTCLGGDPIVEQESEASALPQLPTRRDGGLETPTPQPVHLPGSYYSIKIYIIYLLLSASWLILACNKTTAVWVWCSYLSYLHFRTCAKFQRYYRSRAQFKLTPNKWNNTTALAK